MIIEFEQSDGSKNTYQTVLTSFVLAVLNERVDKLLFSWAVGVWLVLPEK